MRVNLGAADRHIEGFVCVDIADFHCEKCGSSRVITDLNNQWPWPDNSVEEVMALDVCEHIRDMDSRFNVVTSSGKPAIGDGGLFMFTPAYSGRIHFMNELHRVLVPGGKATIETPDAARGAGFCQDPTHTSPWTRNSFQYFGAGPGGDFAWNRLAKAYGITARFEMVSLTEREYRDAYDPVVKLTAVLRAIK